MTRQKISYKKIAEFLSVTLTTVSNKLSGKIKLDEKTAQAIKTLLNVDIPPEELFATADGKCNFEELPEDLPLGKKKVFYPNLDAELNRQKISYKKIAEYLGVHTITVSRKLKGAYPLDEKTAQAIKTLLNVDAPLEVIFQKF